MCMKELWGFAVLRTLSEHSILQRKEEPIARQKKQQLEKGWDGRPQLIPLLPQDYHKEIGYARDYYLCMDSGGAREFGRMWSSD